MTTKIDSIRTPLLFVVLVAATFVVVLSPSHAQEAPLDGDAPLNDSSVAAPIRFDFVDATLDQVIEFFARETGLPVVRETSVPQAVFTYRTPAGETYDIESALRVLNVLLQTQGVMLRVSNDMLYLQSLDKMVIEALPTYEGQLPDEVTDDQIVVNVVPLQNALSKNLAEKLATMIGSYGSVTSMDAQNSLVIVETAGKIRQLLRVIDQLDRSDPAGVIEIFKIEHTQAATLLTPLKALLGERVQKYVINQQGQQVLLEEEEIRGLTMTHDDRSNSIVAKGMQSKIDELRDAIELLDVPASSQQRLIRTFVLMALSPGEAVQQLAALFARLPEAERPALFPQNDSGRVTIVGAQAAVDEGERLLREIDGGGTEATLTSDRSISIMPLQHADPTALAATVQSLLNRRQASAINLVPGPDRRSIIISGLSRDVDAVKALLPALDAPTRIDLDVRMIRLTTADPRVTIDRALELHARREDPTDPKAAVQVEFDADSRTATLVGAPAALDRFSEALRMVESNTVVDRERRQIPVEFARPSEIAISIGAMARQLLSVPGETYIEPQFDAVDPLDVLLVSAMPEQFAVIESLIATFDREQPGDFQFKVVSLAGVKAPEELIARARSLFDRLVRGYDDGEIVAPEIEIDQLSGSLLLNGRAEAVALFERSLSEARLLLPPAREGRMVTLAHAEASAVVAPLQELIDTTLDEGGSRLIAPPEVRVVERTNSLYIVAEPAQHAAITRFISDLDSPAAADLPPLRLIQVRAADALQLAAMLKQRYDARPPEQRRSQPVTIDADSVTNTLIVTAADPLVGEIREFVDSVNEAGTGEAERETRIFPLKLARAVDLAAGLDKLYPEPPMPLDSRGRPLPHLRQPKEVFVTADANTNTLIVEAPAERMPSFVALVEQLDRVQLPPQAQLRTYRVERGDLSTITQTLNNLRSQLVKQPEDGSKPVEVLIQAEPTSRTLIVAGDDVTFAKVEQMLEDLSVVPVPRELRVIEVMRAEPRDLADRALAVYADMTKDDPSAGAVEVEVDESNGTLMVVAEPQPMVKFIGIVNQLQEALGPAADVRLLTLEYARPSEVVSFLDELSTNEIVRFGQGAGAKPTFFPMDRLNAILVSARPEQHPIIASVADSLDRQEAQAMPPLRILQLRSADAQNFAGALMSQYNQRSADERRVKPVTITADPNTNALIVAAHPDLMPEIQTIVDELNDADRIDAAGREIRIFPLRVARAEELARVMDEMYPEPEPLYDRRGNPIPGSKPVREVVVRADPQTNSLIVDATSQRMAGFEKLVEQLDRQQMDADTEIRTYPVIHADLTALATALRNLVTSGAFPGANDRVNAATIAAEPVSNTLVVSGPPAMFDKFEEVLASLDVRRATPATSLRFFTLEKARADSIAPMLREILVARLPEDVPEAGANAEALLNVTSDRKTNTLIISAPEALMPVAAELIEQLDRGAIGLADPVVRVRPLTFASAAEVTTNLSLALPDLISQATGEPVDVRLIPTASSNAVILVGLETDLPQVEALIQDLDKQQDLESMAAETFPLQYTDAATVAPVLKRLLTNQQATDPRVIAQRLRTTRGQMDFTPEIQVEAAGANSLLVSGTRQTVDLAKTLLAKLDQPDDAAARDMATFTPANADPAALVATVRQVIDASRGDSRRSTLEMIVEPTTGSVVVIGRTDEHAQAMALLRRWDDAALAPPQVDLKIVNLSHSDAATTAAALGPLLRDEAMWPEGLRKLSAVGVAISTPTVTADAAENRLLISAPAELMAVAERLLAQIDAPRGGSDAVDVRIFNLQTAKATDVAAAVSAAMSARAARNPGEVEPTITAEPSSNSIVVSATPAQIADVQAIVTSLDEGRPADLVQIRTVFLQHGRAEVVAPVVEQLLTGEDSLDEASLPNWARIDLALRRQQLGGEAPPMRVAADARLNAVVVSGTPGVLDVAEALVRQLDVDADGGAARSVRVLAVENADAAEVAANLDAVFADGGETEPVPVIRVDQSSNALLVRASDRQFEMIEQVVSALDRATIGTRREISTVPIDPSRASAAEVADTLRRLLHRRGGASVEIIRLEDLLPRESDRDADVGDPGNDSGGEPSARLPTSGEAMSPLMQAAVVFAVAASQDARAAESDAGNDADVTIAVDEGTNSLVVIGSPRAVERIRALAAQIESQLPAMPGTIRYIAMPEGVEADAIAPLITQTLSQLTPAGGARGDYRTRVTVLADPANNALIVGCNDVDFETVRGLLHAMASPAASQSVIIKVYPLVKTTAQRAAQSVRDLVGLDPVGPARPRGRQTDRARRTLEIELRADGRTIDAVFDPATIRVSADDQSNSLVVMGPAEAISFIDEFVAFIDQTPIAQQASLRLFPLKHAQAREIEQAIESVLRARYEALDDATRRATIQPEANSDVRTNTLIITAAPDLMTTVEQLLVGLDVATGEARHVLRIIELKHIAPTSAAQTLDKVVLGTDQDVRRSTAIVPLDDVGRLLVRASAETNAEIDQVLAEIDRDGAREFEVRTITLSRANAGAVAETIQNLYDQRAQIAGEGRNRRTQRRVAIVGDENSNTLVVSAADDEFDRIAELVKQFDSMEAFPSLELKVYQLKHAKAREIEQTVQDLVNELMYSQGPMFWDPWGFSFMGGRNRAGQRNETQGRLAVRANERLNALIATGQGDKFAMVDRIIETLDAPVSEGAARVVRVYRLKHAPLDVAMDMIEEALAQGSDTRSQRWWEPTTSDLVIREIESAKSLVISATPAEHESIAPLVAMLDETATTEAQTATVLPVQFARATEVAQTLTQFLRQRAAAENRPRPTAVILGSDASNNLIVSANAVDLALVRDLLSRVDQPNSEDRVVRIIALKKGDAEDVARIISEVFGGRGGRGVEATADVRTNSLIVNAPNDLFPVAEQMISTLDSPPPADDMVIRTYALGGASANEVVRLLTDALDLDAEGETSGVAVTLDELGGEPVNVQAKIVADRRSNNVIVRATPESFGVIETLIERIDTVEVKSPVEWRIIPLKHALVYDVSFTLRQFLRQFAAGDQPEPKIDYNEPENQLFISATADQFKQIDALLAEIDLPKERPLVRFVNLQFADAVAVRDALSSFYGPIAPYARTPEQVNTRVVANPPTNSLLVSTSESEWEHIQKYIEQFDNEMYDPRLQLKVIPLRYADASSVAQAINDAFAGQVQQGGEARNQQPNRPSTDGDGERREQPAQPTVLVEAEDWVRAGAEPQTNTVIVSASRQNLGRIETIIQELDVAEFARGPAPRLIPVRTGNAAQFAQSLNAVYAQGGGGRQPRGVRGVSIVGNEASGMLIVRAEDEEFAQIQTLAEALQTSAAEQGLSVHVLRLTDAPAARVEEAIREAFAAKAEQTSQPFSIKSDVSANSLIIASTATLFAEIEQTVQQLDELQPAAGQGIFIIELENVDPDTAASIVETIGLNQRQDPDSTSRLVTEPIKVAAMPGRNAVIVVANPVDRETIIGIFKAIDAEGEFADTEVRIVHLRNAQAAAVAGIIEQMLSAGDQQSSNPIARAVQEQVRRLSVRREAVDGLGLSLDLAKPIRVIVNESSNSIIIGSTSENLDALGEVIGTLDQLPISSAVMVQIFPLEFIRAGDFQRLVMDLFEQGRDLGTTPLTDVQGVPDSEVGRALIGEIAMTVDERTNTVVVAGPEESVAFVEVMRQRLDSESIIGWVEPRVIALKHADAADLAELIQMILVEGNEDLPQSAPIQDQIGRIRVSQGQPGSDVFAPMSRLVVRPHERMNALIVVGTRSNLDAIEQLVGMFDIPEASPESSVRVYPVKHASAGRLQATLERLFDQQVQAGVIREEDAVVAQADERTNSLIVTTSSRSFALVESLLETLDAEAAPEFASIRRIEVKNASASALAPMIEELMEARVERLREVEPETAYLEEVSIVADARTNSLIIAAANGPFEVIRQLAADLDQATRLAGSGVTVLPMARANVDRIAATLEQIFERKYADMPPEVRNSQQPLILTDPRTNALLVAANEGDLADIRQIVEQIESTPANPAVGITVLPLDRPRATELAPRLEGLMEDRLTSLGSSRTDSDTVSIEPHEPSNSLIIAANDEHVQVIRGLIDALAQAEAAAVAGVIEVISLSRNRASDLIEVIDEMYVQAENEKRGVDVIRITPDDRLNALVVNAPEADIAAIRTLVARLEGERNNIVVEIKTLSLTAADPLEVVGLLEEVLRGPGTTGRRNAQQSVIFKLITQAAEEDGVIDDRTMDEVEISVAIREAISLTPDRRTNSIIVAAPKESMALIETLVAQWDQSTEQNKTLRVFTLVNADAQATAEILRELFRTPNREVLTPVAGEVGDAGAGVEGGVDAPPGLSRTELTTVPDERKQLSITVDSRTNSLIVAGTPWYLDLVQEVVDTLDTKDANERVQWVYPLKNAVAEEVARVVSEFVAQDQEKLISTIGVEQLGAANRLLEREVTIVGDVKSNTVLVSASPRYIDRVKDMIAKLDVDPPQVLIQVLLAEITLDSGDEWGVRFRAEGNVGDIDVGAGYGLASSFLNALGVPSVSVAGTDFRLLIKALQTQGRLQVLSNPSVMAANNEPALIQVGETIRVPAATQVTDAGIQSSVVEQEIGVILNVTPTINPDGFVRMEINPEISNLSQRTTQISEDFESPIITVRRADTVVTVMDGQTVVLGGLISDRFEVREEAVPLLSDLPILGALFRSNSEQRAKTELLIVLTPHVITSPTEVRSRHHDQQTITDEEIDRLTLPEEIKEQIRRGTIEGTGESIDARARRLSEQAREPARREEPPR
jgi:type II secretion system protein D